MTRKQIRISTQMSFTWFMLAGLILLFAPGSLTNKFQFAFARVFHWPLSVSKSISLSVRAQQSPTDVISRSKYNKLQNRLANVTQWLHQERQKVEELTGLRDRSVWKGVKFVLADVITSSDRTHNRLIINRGRSDGLAKGQFVLGNDSIIGTISDVDRRIAQVNLTTDPTSKMAVKIAELEAGMIMQGCGNNSAKILLLPIKRKVEVGDIVYAQKNPEFLDAPMIVGTVAQCKKDDENPLLWDITVTPTCDIERLSNVDVIIMNPQE